MLNVGAAAATSRPTATRRSLIVGGLALVVWPAAGRAGSAEVKIRDLWGERGRFSDLARSLEGKRIAVRGYMAPPLKAETDFFVLTKLPMAFCPFCDNAASWPDDLMLVKVVDAVAVVQFNTPIVSEGLLELGIQTDAATGFVSRIRLTDAFLSHGLRRGASARDRAGRCLRKLRPAASSSHSPSMI